MNKKYMFFYSGKIVDLSIALKKAKEKALSAATDKAVGKHQISISS